MGGQRKQKLSQPIESTPKKIGRSQSANVSKRDVSKKFNDSNRDRNNIYIKKKKKVTRVTRPKTTVGHTSDPSKVIIDINSRSTVQLCPVKIGTTLVASSDLSESLLDKSLESQKQLNKSKDTLLSISKMSLSSTTTSLSLTDSTSSSNSNVCLNVSASNLHNRMSRISLSSISSLEKVGNSSNVIEKRDPTLRWDPCFIKEDAEEETQRIENYKEERRSRYRRMQRLDSW